MAEVEIVVTGRNMSGAAMGAAKTEVTDLSAKADELSMALRKAALSANSAGQAATRAMTSASAAADRAVASNNAAFDAAIRAAEAQAKAADAADKLAAGEIKAADAEKLQADAALRVDEAVKAQAKADLDAARAADAQARAALAAERAQIAQAESAGKVAEAQRVAAAETRKTSEETSAFSKIGGAASAVWGSLKIGMLGVGAAAVYGVDKAAKFNAAMVQLNTQAGVSKDKLAGLSQGVLKLAGDVGFSPDSLAESLFHVESNMASMGISSQKALEMVRIAAEGAKVGNANLVDVTNALTAAVASGIPGVKDLNQAMGALNATVGAGDMKMEDLAKAFGTGMVATVKGYGLSIKDVGAALATFGDNNVRGAVAGTQLRMAVQSLAVPAKSAGDELKKLGLSTDTLAKDMQSGGLLKALEDLKGRMDKAGIAANQQGQVITDLFGKKAGTGVNILIGQLDRLKSKYPDITKAANGFGQSWEETQKTASQGFDRLKTTLEALAITFGNALLPGVNALGQAMSKALADPQVQKSLQDFGKYLGEVFKDMSPLIPVVAKLADQLMQALGPALPPIANALVKVGDALGKSLGDVIKQMAPYLPKLAKAFGDLAIALIPLIPSIAKVIIAFLPLMPTITRGIEVLAKITAKVAEFIAWWDGHLTPALKKGAQLFDDVTKAIWKVWKWLYDELIGHSIIPDMINGMLSWFRKGVDGVRNIINWFEGLPGMFSKWMSGMVDAVSKGVGNTVGWFKGLPGKITGALGNFGSLLYGAGQNVISGLISGINSMVGAVGATMSNIAGVIRSHLPFSPAKVGPLSGEGSPDKSGAKIGRMLADGMNSARGVVGDAASNLAHIAHEQHMQHLRHLRHGRHPARHHRAGHAGGSPGVDQAPYIGDLSWTAAGVRYTVGRAGQSGGSSGSAAGSTSGSAAVGAAQHLTVEFAPIHVEIDLHDSGGHFSDAQLRELRRRIRIGGGQVQKVLGH